MVLSASAKALCAAYLLHKLTSIPIYEPPEAITRLFAQLVAAYGGILGSISCATAIAGWWRVRRNADMVSAVARVLDWLPPSMRDDAEGLIREFADLRDRDRELGRPQWRTGLKCGWFMTVYVLRVAIDLAFAGLVARLLRL